MELVNDFTVSAGIEEAWKTLTDLELIAPCMPGAQLTEIEGETYRGLVKVKVGPITAQFKGQANFVERDAENHKAVLKADGRDTGGKGNASALITAQLAPVDAGATKVTVTTDLTITGKVAQFGRGALADVSDKILKQFVYNLETTVLAEGAASQTPAATQEAEATDATADRAAADLVETTEAVAVLDPSTDSDSDSDVDDTAVEADDAIAPSATITDGPGISSTAEPLAALADIAPPPVQSTPAPAKINTPPVGPAVAAPSSSDRFPTDAGPAPAPGVTEKPRVRQIESKPVEPIDLLETAGAPILKRLVPVLGALLVLLFFARRRRS